VGIGTAAAQGPVNHYLALGDSIPFGFNPLVPLGDLLDYHGYPQYVTLSLPLDLANASCPGETSSSFLDVTAPDEGCHEWRAASGPLFVTYSDLAQSQLNYTISFLRANPRTRLVTITIGGDDLLLLQDTCAAQSTDPAVITSCELAGLGKVLATFAKNLTAIYVGIRIAGHYEGPIVIEGLLGFSAQRQVFLGFAPAKLLLAFSFPDVLDEDTGRGYQRRFNPQHSLDFRKYIQLEGSSTIPLTFNLRPRDDGACGAGFVLGQ
jgi:hypothetical protein